MKRAFTRADGSLRRALVCSALCLFLTAGAVPALGAGTFSFTDLELCMMRKTNHARRVRGLSTLNNDRQLGEAARYHAAKEASRLSYFHGSLTFFTTSITNWTRIGDNVGRGPGCRRLFRAFMASPAHRSTMLGSYRWQGFGAKRGADGRIYVDHILTSGGDPGTTL